MPSARLDRSKYSQVKEEIENDSELSFGSEFDQKRLRSLILSIIPWVLVVLLSCLSLFLYLKTYSAHHGGLDGGWDTDFGPAKSALQMKHLRFTGGPAYTENGSFYIPNPDEIKYVGVPTPEIDEAWEHITKEEEAKSAWPENYRDFWHVKKNAYVAGLDLFHTLHCVNQLRKTLHPGYYTLKHGANALVHNGHCIDQIRQYIMCSGDITPIPTRYFPSRDRNYVDSDVVHTCRDFESLRQWISDRVRADSGEDVTAYAEGD